MQDIVSTIDLSGTPSDQRAQQTQAVSCVLEQWVRKRFSSDRGYGHRVESAVPFSIRPDAVRTTISVFQGSFWGYEVEVGAKDADFDQLRVRLQYRYPAADWVGRVFFLCALPLLLLSTFAGLGPGGKKSGYFAAAIAVLAALICTAAVRLVSASIAALVRLRRPREEGATLREELLRAIEENRIQP